MDDSGGSDLGFTLLKYVVLLATLPIWGPFAKALWEEFVHGMRADGGLVGPDPGPRQRKEIEEQIAREEPRQVHELLAHHRLMVAQGRGNEGPEGVGTPDEAAKGPAARGRSHARPAAEAARGFRR